MTDDDVIRFTLRIPRTLFEAISESADVNGRSANSEIFSTLNERYGVRGSNNLAQLRQYRGAVLDSMRTARAQEHLIRNMLKLGGIADVDRNRFLREADNLAMESEEAKLKLGALDAAILALEREAGREADSLSDR